MELLCTTLLFLYGYCLVLQVCLFSGAYVHVHVCVRFSLVFFAINALSLSLMRALRHTHAFTHCTVKIVKEYNLLAQKTSLAYDQYDRLVMQKVRLCFGNCVFLISQEL